MPTPDSQDPRSSQLPPSEDTGAGTLDPRLVVVIYIDIYIT